MRASLALYIIFLTMFLLSCGQNFEGQIEKERVYNAQMEKEVQAMKSDLKDWATQQQQEMLKKKEEWKNLPAEMQAFKRDSTIRFIGTKMDSSAVAVENWLKTNGAEATDQAKVLAQNLKSWDKLKHDAQSFGKNIGKMAKEFATDASEAAKYLKEDVEKVRASKAPKKKEQ